MENGTEPRTNVETINIYAALLWHWAWLLILATLIAGGLTYWLSKRQTPVYQATALVLVDSAPDPQAVTYDIISASQLLADTYAQEMTAQPVLDEVAKRLKLPGFPQTASVDVNPIQDTQLMTVTVMDTDRQRVPLLASTLVQAFSDQLQADHEARYATSKKGLQDQMASLDRLIQSSLNELDTLAASNQNQTRQDQLQTTVAGYRQSYSYVLQSYQDVLLAEANSSSGIIMRQPPVTPVAPVSPKPVRNALLAALVGVLLAAGAIFLIDFLDNTIRGPEEITRTWGIPVLGIIVNHIHDENELITLQQPRSPITEAFRSLRTNLAFTSFNTPSPTILITSPSPEDGKTTVVANLGNVIAQGGRKVALVDADMRKPRLHKMFQMSNRTGLSDQFILPEARLDGAMKQTKIIGLQVLTAGNIPPNPSELLSSEKMGQLLKQLSSQFDTIVLDTPPLLIVTDALVMAPLVDGVILVVKPTVTSRVALKNAMEQLKQVKANVLGVILNDVKMGRSRYYYYHYYSNYYYARKNGKGYHYTQEGGAS